ncbi:tetratricopeptide repeat protein [bacterium]|nr:tetratricopeptide repeat protein [bacterium]
MKKNFLSLAILMLLAVIGAFLGLKRAASPSDTPSDERIAEAESYDLLIQEGSLLIQREDYAQARKVFQKALAMNEDDCRAYYNLGLIIFAQVRAGLKNGEDNKEKLEEAARYFTSAIERKKDYASSYALRGLCLDFLEQKEKALEDYSNYLELTDDNDESTFKQHIQNRIQSLYGVSK